MIKSRKPGLIGVVIEDLIKRGCDVSDAGKAKKNIPPIVHKIHMAWMRRMPDINKNAKIAIAKFPYNERDIMFDYFIGRISYKEAKVALPYTSHTVQKRISYYVAQLAKLYNDRFDDRLNGNAVCGNSNGNSKLNDEKVREIRKKLAAGMLQVDIAKEYNVTKPTISNINARISWTHVI